MLADEAVSEGALTTAIRLREQAKARVKELKPSREQAKADLKARYAGDWVTRLIRRRGEPAF